MRNLLALASPLMYSRYLLAGNVGHPSSDTWEMLSGLRRFHCCLRLASRLEGYTVPTSSSPQITASSNGFGNSDLTQVSALHSVVTASFTGTE